MSDYDRILANRTSEDSLQRLVRKLATILADGNTGLLMNAFTWCHTPQGHHHWQRVRARGKITDPKDIDFLTGLMAAALKALAQKDKPRISPMQRDTLALILSLGYFGQEGPSENAIRIYAVRRAGEAFVQLVREVPALAPVLENAGTSAADVADRMKDGIRMTEQAHAALKTFWVEHHYV